MKISSKGLKRIMSVFIVAIMSLTSFTAFAETIVEIIDPTPDTKPPVLNSLSISSNQASPSNAVKITADVSDDLSGVSGGYISYRKPSGNTKGVSLYLNQTTQKYEGTINIDIYDEAGEWVLNYINLTDKKDNSGYVYDNSSTATGQKFDFAAYNLTVSGVTSKPVSTDIIAPTLNIINISATEISGIGTVKVSADVSDDDSGVDTVRVYYLKPSGRSYYVYLYYNNVTAKYEGNISIDQYEELGVWKLSYVYLQDKAGNYKYIYDSAINPTQTEKQDFSNCNLTVAGVTVDLIAPSLIDLSINKIQGSNNTATIQLTAKCEDDLAGVYRVSGVYTKPSGKNVYVSFNLNSTTGKYETSIPIDKYDEMGTWKLNYITLYDKKDNNKTMYYYSSSGDFNSFDFTVRGVITIPPPSPFSVEIVPKKVMLEKGQSQKLSVVLHMTDEATKDITSGSTGTVYTSSNPSAVSVTQDGMVTVAADAPPATVFIQATNGGLSSQCRVVIPGVITETNLQIIPMSMSLYTGQTKQLNVIATSADGVSKDVTSSSSGITYTSSDMTRVTVDQNGLIKVLPTAAKGTAKVLVNYMGVTSESVVTVTGEPEVSSILMTPDVATVNYGETVQLSVRGTLTDGSTKDVTAGANGTVYNVSDTTKATVDTNGLVTIASNATSGNVTVKATNNGVSAQSVITINGIPVPTDITLGEITSSIYPNTTHQLSVKATYSDGSVKDITASSTGTTYRASNAYATVNAEGVVTISPTAKVGGSVIIYAYNGNLTKSMILTIAEDITDKITDIKLESDAVAYNLGKAYQFRLTGVYGDGTTKDITASSAGTTYRASNAYATVDTEGIVTISPTAKADGSVILYAYNGNLTKSMTLTITEDLVAKITSLSLENDAISYNPGIAYQFKVTGGFSDGTTKDVTSSGFGTTYRASNAYATVDAEGKVTIAPTAKVGGTVILYAYNGTFTASKTLMIGDDTSNKVTSIKFESNSLTLSPGTEYQLTTSEVYDNGTTKDITASSVGTTYRASNAYATVDAGGKVTIAPTAKVGGSVIIYAYNNNFTATMTVTISEDLTSKPTSIKLENSDTAYTPGNAYQFTVAEVYGNGNTNDVTSSSEGTTYRASNAYATVDAEGKVTIAPTAKVGGNVIIYAYNGTFTAPKTITITEAAGSTFSSIKLESSAITYNPGKVYQMDVIGQYADGSAKDISESSEGTTYRASNAYATVDANGKVTISATAKVGGTVTIYSYNGKLISSTIITISEDSSTKIATLSLTSSDDIFNQGTQHQFKVTGTYGDGTTKDITLATEGTTYRASNAYATVDTNGKVTISPTSRIGRNVIIYAYNRTKVASYTITIN